MLISSFINLIFSRQDLNLFSRKETGSEFEARSFSPLNLTFLGHDQRTANRLEFGEISDYKLKIEKIRRNRMPMIEAKVTMQLSEEKRDVLKTEFGKAIAIMGKPESYLMINLVDNQDLYFGGKKLDKGAYVDVKILGSVDGNASGKMTARLCEILEKELGIPGNAVYVSYWGTANWGWNGGNF